MSSLTTTYSNGTSPHHPLSWRALAFANDGSLTQTLLRLTLGSVLLPHGAQHLFGAFGGYGFTGTFGWMTGTLGIPAPFAAAGILVEFFGSLLLILGVAARPLAAALAVFLTTAASTHVANGFFMNWLGTMPGGVEGFEYHLLAIVLAVTIAIRGGGAFALDRRLSRS